MAGTSVSVAKNHMRRAVASILDPWPANKTLIWEFFESACAYCGVDLIKAERRGHIDHADSNAGNHLGNLVLACSVCNGDEKLDMGWRDFLAIKVSDLATCEERVDRIERWQEMHPVVESATSAEVAALDTELSVLIDRFGVKSAELRAAVARAKQQESS